jgi:hypothetical protein
MFLFLLYFFFAWHSKSVFSCKNNSQFNIRLAAAASHRSVKTVYIASHREK